MSKNGVAIPLFLGSVWLLLGTGGFALVESHGTIVKLGFTIAWLLAFHQLPKILRLFGQSNEIPTGVPRARTAVLIVIVLAWTLGTIFALDRLKLTGVAETLSWVGSVAVLLVTIYLIETHGFRQET